MVRYKVTLTAEERQQLEKLRSDIVRISAKNALLEKIGSR